MRSLKDLYAEGGESRLFAEDFVGIPHGGDWAPAIHHWELTVSEYLDECKDMEGLSRTEAMQLAEEMAQDSLLIILQMDGQCPWCP